MHLGRNHSAEIGPFPPEFLSSAGSSFAFSMISSHCFELLASIHITLGEVGLFLASRNTTEQHVVSRERDLIEGEQGEPRVLDAEERADFTDLHIQLYQSSGFCSAHPGLGCDVLYGVLQTSPITNPVDGSNTAARMLSVPPSIERTKGVGFWEVVERMKGVLRRKMIKIRKRGECN